jgi:hypothetical protein
MKNKLTELITWLINTLWYWIRFVISIVYTSQKKVGVYGDRESGKSTILRSFLLGTIVQVNKHYSDANIRKVYNLEYGNIHFTNEELPDLISNSYWTEEGLKSSYGKLDGVVFTIKCTKLTYGRNTRKPVSQWDADKFSTPGDVQTIKKLIRYLPDNCPVLIFMTHHDQASIRPDVIRELYKLQETKKAPHLTFIQPCNGETGKGVYEGFEWLFSTMAQNNSF